MVSVCDKCMEKGTLKKVKVGEREYDICSNCSSRIIEWIAEGKQQKGVIGKLFS